MRTNRTPFLALLLTMLAAIACLAPTVGAAGPRAAYVTSVVGNSVATLDAFTGVFGAPLAIPNRPWGVAIAPDGATAYVSNQFGASVTPIDTATNTPGTPIAVGSDPRTIGIAPDGATAYVANLGSGTVTPIDTATNTAGSPIPVGSLPHGIAIAPDGSRVYVANLASNSVSAIDTATNTVVDTIPTATGPYTIAITPDGKTLYAATPYGPNVLPIDTATATAGTPIPVGSTTFGVAAAPDGETVYVTPSSAHTVVPIDTATQTAGTPIPVGSLPEGLGVTPDGSTAYVTDVGTNSVYSLDLETGAAGPPVSVAQAPMTVAIAPNQSPTAALATSVDGQTATFDASASSDSDGTVASYRWDFGDGHTTTGSQPTSSHDYAPGSYTATLTVTDDEGCSNELVYTGQTASCVGSPAARVTRTVTVAAAPATAHQAIERFTLDGPCVRRARDGKARIGLRLLLAQPGSVAIQVDRAVSAKRAARCPKPNPNRRYTGKLRRVETIANVTPVAASVQRRLTRSFSLRPGLYRISVRAHDGDGMTRAAYRWVRVLKQSGGR